MEKRNFESLQIRHIQKFKFSSTKSGRSFFRQIDFQWISSTEPFFLPLIFVIFVLRVFCNSIFLEINK
ncbi:hypothetical protein B9Z55_027092 [Caenorhabditis nigoni]|uniref:Uncharacterized protein n=1 Tax=Caenorhabditis nigoni TaxID=1611254 RepID=A0A2G5SJ77_9PELO|nr:hypothetical protein B9Z55_027092 [Caenorhabditis nigoni]